MCYFVAESSRSADPIVAPIQRGFLEKTNPSKTAKGEATTLRRYRWAGAGYRTRIPGREREYRGRFAMPFGNGGGRHETPGAQRKVQQGTESSVSALSRGHEGTKNFTKAMSHLNHSDSSVEQVSTPDHVNSQAGPLRDARVGEVNCLRVCTDGALAGNVEFAPTRNWWHRRIVDCQWPNVDSVADRERQDV